jgi:hypothetical protein
LRNLGYTYLFSSSFDQTVQLYQAFSSASIAIISRPTEVQACFQQPYCILSDQNPHGLPLWKLLSFHFWTFPDHPLGHRWTLSPEDYQLEGKGYLPNLYLGYSIVETFQNHKPVPYGQRQHQVYIYGSSLSFFFSNETVWPHDFYEAAIEETGVKIVIGASKAQPTDPDPVLPSWLTNMGSISKDSFISTVGRSKVLIGQGHAWT